jgi:hypothetical protein
LDGNIEIREIDKYDKTKAHKIIFKSLEELDAYVPPSYKHVYCGIYTRKGNKGNAVGCRTTGVLWADFDYKTKEQVQYIIDNSGLPKPSILVSSGYGIHVYWILKERAGNEAVSILKAIAHRTGADSKAAEKARVLRVPGTMNVKKDEAVECKILEFKDIRYEIGEFKKVLQQEVHRIESYRIESGEIEIKELENCSRACIRVMAKGTDEGHRNFALCKITKYLQLKGYTRREALDVIRRWNTLNTPPKADSQLLIEFNKVWSTDYKLLGCRFKDNQYLQEQSDYFCSMGECEYSTMQSIDIIGSDTRCKVDNLIFEESIYREMKGMELAIFFTIAKTEGITREHLAKIIGVHKKNETFIKSIEHLKELKFINIISGNKRLKEKELLILGNDYTYGRGYTIVNNLLSETYLGKRITDTEYKLLVLLKYYSFQESTINPSRDTLAIKMGTTPKTITNTLNQLESKFYIKRTYHKLDNGSTKFYIKLLF